MTDIPLRLPIEAHYRPPLFSVVHECCHERCLCHKPLSRITWQRGDPTVGLPASQPYTKPWQELP